MSDFKVEVTRIVEVNAHPNADRLELATVFGYQCIVLKGKFSAGDLIAYIPEGALMPDDLIEQMGLTGRLAGSGKNRVKAVRLRGILSQGLVLSARDGWTEGDDVAEELGIQKWNPLKHSPNYAARMADVWHAGNERCLRYDIENLKRWPGVLEEGEPVVMTEKIHGTFCGIAFHPERLAHPEHGRHVVFSKGRGKQGLAMKLGGDTPSLYERAYRLLNHEKIEGVRSGFGADASLFILGEVFGKGMQDLTYGADVADDEAMGFRVFDVVTVIRGEKGWFSALWIDRFCRHVGLDRVPILYAGPFSMEALNEHMNGKETISGKQLHVREGVVIRPTLERRHPDLGRVQLKAVSDAYLLRKNGTEYQ